MRTSELTPAQKKEYEKEQRAHEREIAAVYDKGMRDGRAQLQNEIRALLGVYEPEE